MEIYAVKIMNISNEELNDLCSTLDVEKRCKLEKYIKLEDKIRSLIGDLLIRTLINKKFKIRNKNIIIEKNQYGKPFLKGNPKHNFNISHSEDFVVCAISDTPIGIDIEKIKQIEYKEIAKGFFTENEYDYITRGDAQDQLKNFFNIWTLKESFIKCCGTGLSMPLNLFSLEIDNINNIRLIHKLGESNSKYYFEVFDIDSEYKMAVCSLNKNVSGNLVMIDQQSLIKDYYKLVLDGGTF